MQTIERINKNIYHINENMTLFDGGDIENNNSRPTAKIVYIDSFKPEKTMNAVMKGGYRKKNNSVKGGVEKKQIVIYASPEYVENNDLRLFMDKMFLYYRFSHSPSAAIYVIPPSNVLKEMIAKRSTKNEEGSVEMQQEVRTNKEIGWERYIFTTYGDNTSNNKYRIDEKLDNIDAYPNSSFDTVRRTNTLGEVFYFSYVSAKEVKVHTMENNATDGNKLKFVARFNNGGYIFQGLIPMDAVEKLTPKQTKAKNNKNNFRALNLLSGGNNNESENSSLHVLQEYDNMYNNDHDIAAEHYLRCVNNKIGNDKMTKYLNNGDLIFSAIQHALLEPNDVTINDIGNEKPLNYSAFKPCEIDHDLHKQVKTFASNKLKQLYKKYTENDNCNKFIDSYKHMYKNGNNATITADIVTGYLRNNQNANIEEDTLLIYNEMKQPHKSSPVASIIYNAFRNNPLPSAFGAEYYPVLNDYESFESVAKNDSKRSKKDSTDDEVDGVKQIFEAKPKEMDKNKSESEDEQEEEQEKENDVVEDDDVIIMNSDDENVESFL